MSLIDRLTSRLVVEEGEGLKMYYDSKGIPTIGVGHNIRDNPISQLASRIILGNDINIVFDQLDRNLPWWRDLNEDRQLVLADLCFNMGIGVLLTFRNTLKAVQEGRYSDAANGLRNSQWYKDVGPGRADPLIKLMEGTT